MVLKWSLLYQIILVLIVVLFKPCYSGLTITKPCGQIVCAEMQYCSQFGSICQACSDVCDLHSHNYHVDTCHQFCQDYLHNQQFVSKRESARDAATLAELSRDVRTLKVMVWVSLAFSILLLLLLLGLCANKVARARRRHGGLVAIIRNAFHVFKVDVANLKLDIPIVPAASFTAPNTASTTLPNTPPDLPPRVTYSSKQRSPSEDATLDYAYDNAAMTPSPTFTKTADDVLDRSRETNF
ncbi:hypothetical protein B566_EDAN010501 [Ephemera danica]|nr:hypothetical protein B566_EDAN010501 [Ephemera danica]